MNRKSILRLAVRIIVLGLIIFGITSTSNAAEIVESGKMGAECDNMTWTLDSDGVLTISGTGEMGDEFYWNDDPWYEEGRGRVTKVIINEGVTSVGEYVFQDETNLTSVMLPSTLTKIDRVAFVGCSNLTSIVLPDNIQIIGSSVFNGCSKLATVKFPANLTEIGSSAFAYCKSLKTLDFPNGLKKIGESAFKGCTGLTKVEFPVSVEVIETYAFNDCSNLKAMIFAGDVKELSEHSYYNCHEDLVFYGIVAGNVKYAAEYHDYPFCLITDQKALLFYLGPDKGETYATLTWKPVGLCDGYKVYKYDTSAKKYVHVGTAGAAAKTYKVTGLTAGTQYQYKICPYVEVAGMNYNGKDTFLKFKTHPQASTITAKNTKISTGFSAAAIKTVTNTYTGLYGFTLVDYSRYAAEVSEICQFKDDKGNYCVAYLNKARTHVFIRAYNKDMKQVYYRKVSADFERLGTVVCDDKGNFYIITGEYNNTDNSNVKNVAVSKYTKAGKLVKTIKLSGAKGPFVSGNCDAVIYGNLLYCNMGKARYDGHQSNMNFGIRTDTMTQDNVFYNYCSHSFDQRILFDKDGNGWFVNHGDAYPRGFQVDYDTGGMGEEDYVPFHFFAKKSSLECDDMITINQTHADLGGIVEASTGMVLVGASVKSLQESGYYSQKKNLFVMYADPNKQMQGGVSRTGICLGENVTDKGIKWLTSYTGQDVQNPQVVMTDDDRIVVLWETSKYVNDEYQNTYYMILSSTGKVLQKAVRIPGVRLNAHEQPIYKDGFVYWSTCYANNGMLESNKLRIHRLNINLLNFDKTTLAVTGLKVPSKTKNSVTLKWNKNAKADGYNIYRYNTVTKKYIKLASVKSGTLTKTVKNLKARTNYTFAVQAYKKIGNTTYKGNYKTIKVKTK